MAEERVWRQRHAHEANTTAFGSFGTATYSRAQEDWTFLRQDDRTVNGNDINGTTDGQPAQVVSFITEPTVAVQPSLLYDEPSKSRKNRNLAASYPEVAFLSSVIHNLDGDQSFTTSTAQDGICVDFGSAVWLGADGIDSGNLTVPITAYATGLSKDQLVISCVGKQHLDHRSTDGIESRLRIPTVVATPQATWPSTESIKQISFSRRARSTRNGTYLAVRQNSQTTIFEPLLRRDSFAPTAELYQSSLEPNLLLTFDISVTGGCVHADISFHPLDQQLLALIDVEGNWSVWKIRGRRAHTAHQIYEARLKASGKHFSWESKKRPEGVAVYFDGWHKVVWVSSNGTDIDHLLVCNRQTAKLFDMHGREVNSVDVRLDTRKAGTYILDARTGPKPNLCFVLTTSLVLIFDFARKEWKDGSADRGPALLYALQHFKNPADISLKMTEMRLGEGVLLVLYSDQPKVSSLYQLCFRHNTDGTSVIVFDPSSLKLPNGIPQAAVASFCFVTIEASERGHKLILQWPTLACLVIALKDCSVYTAIVECCVRSEVYDGGSDRICMLRLPPDRSLQTKSQRYVDDMDDEEDMLGFIVADHESEIEEEQEVQKSGTYDDTEALLPKYIQTTKDLSRIAHDVTTQRQQINPVSRRNVPEALEELEHRLQAMVVAGEEAEMRTMLDLFDYHKKVGDIEADSATLNRALHMMAATSNGGLQIASITDVSSDSLLKVYEDVFKESVGTLPDNVSDRSRVQREREARDVALDIYLSSRTIRVSPRNDQTQTQDAETLTDSDPFIFSDPLVYQDINQPSFPLTSASQPQPAMNPINARLSSTPPPSLLTNIYSRLSTLCKISGPLQTAITEDESISSNISSLLTHLPFSPNADPSSYSWQATELQLATERAELLNPERLNSKSKKKADKLAKARQRADVTNGEALHQLRKGHGPISLIDRLPIRSQPTPTVIARDTKKRSVSGPSETQPRRQLIMSDGYVPNERSSQTTSGAAGIALTQPERGAFANRAGGGGKDKRKKKKKHTPEKRMRGF